MWDLIKRNYSSHVHHNERKCHPVQHCGSFMCFDCLLNNNKAPWHRDEIHQACVTNMIHVVR